MKLVQAWIEIHREDLMVDWKLAVAGEPVFKIDPHWCPVVEKINPYKGL